MFILPHSTEFLQSDNQPQQSLNYERQIAQSQLPQNHTDTQSPVKRNAWQLRIKKGNLDEGE